MKKNDWINQRRRKFPLYDLMNQEGKDKIDKRLEDEWRRMEEISRRQHETRETRE